MANAPREAGDLASGDSVGPDLRIVRALHTGAFARVFEVVDVVAGDSRAVKIVTGDIGKDARFREVFLDEAKRVATLSNENLARVTSSAIEPVLDAPYVVMELCEGSTLGARMENGVLPPAEAFAILEKLASALTAAHDASLTHADLKPESILVPTSPPGGAPVALKLLFMGAAKLASRAKRNTTAAMSRPLWMAPEQAETDVVPTPATDVWSFGLLAYWCLTGKLFWRAGRDAGSAMMTLMREVLFDPVPAASARANEQGVAALLPPGFDMWFARCVSRDRQQRFSHARDAFAALIPHFDAAGVSTSPLRAPALTSNAAPPGAPGVPRDRPPERRPLPSSNVDPAAALLARGGAAPAAPAKAHIGGWWDRARRRPGRSAAFAAGAAVVLGVLVYVFAIRDTRSRRDDRRRDDDDTAERRHEAKKRPENTPWSDEGCPLPVTSRDPAWGSRDAPVTIVEFSSLRCEACNKIETKLAVLRQEYGPSRLRVVWKNGPSGGTSDMSADALVGEAVFQIGGNDAFWRLHASATSPGPQAGRDIEDLAVGAGVDKEKLSTRKLDAEVATKVRADIDLASRTGVFEVPTLFVNGKPFAKSAPIGELEAAIDEAEREAAAARAAGTPASSTYVTLATRNYAPPRPDVEGFTPPPLLNLDRTIYKVPIGDSPIYGARSAPITIVEFGDFECPYTRQAQETLTLLGARHSGEVRFVWRDNPLPAHKRAEPAAELARYVRKELGDDAFWSLHDTLLAQGAALDDDSLRLDAEIAGVEPDAAMDAVHTSKYLSGISSDQDLADDLGERATPTFYVNGRRLRGAVSIEVFEAVIAEERARAEKLLASGTVTDDQLYDALVRDGKAPASFETKSPGSTPKGAPNRGAKKPKVTIVEFGDFQCGHCKDMQSSLDELMTTYGDRVSLVWRNAPSDGHPDAVLAAEAALEVKSQLGNEGFWRFVDKLFAAEGQSDGLDRAHLEKYATDVGCDMTKFKEAVDKHKHKDDVMKDRSDAGGLGVSGVPTFFVGDYYLPGEQSKDRLERAITRALARAH